MKDYIFSIIVPVYNSSKYLRECIESLLSQKNVSFEIIIIDDGSTDDSLSICEEYKNTNNNIILITQNNSGPSCARNIGLDNAQGKYILFVDSDDSFSRKDALEIILKNIKNNDILSFGYEKKYKNKNTKMVVENTINSIKNYNELVLTDEKIAGFLWNKVFIRNIIINNKLCFNKEHKYCEDLLFVLDYLKYCKTVSYCNEVLYSYRMRYNNLSANLSKNKNIKLLDLYNELMIKYQDCQNIITFLKKSYLTVYYKMSKYLSNSEKNNYKLTKEKEFIQSLNLYFRIKLFIIKNMNSIYMIKSYFNRLIYFK